MSNILFFDMANILQCRPRNTLSNQTIICKLFIKVHPDKLTSGISINWKHAAHCIYSFLARLKDPHHNLNLPRLYPCIITGFTTNNMQFPTRFEFDALVLSSQIPSDDPHHLLKRSQLGATAELHCYPESLELFQGEAKFTCRNDEQVIVISPTHSLFDGSHHFVFRTEAATENIPDSNPTPDSNPEGANYSTGDTNDGSNHRGAFDDMPLSSETSLSLPRDRATPSDIKDDHFTVLDHISLETCPGMKNNFFEAKKVPSRFQIEWARVCVIVFRELSEVVNEIDNQRKRLAGFNLKLERRITMFFTSFKKNQR